MSAGTDIQREDFAAALREWTPLAEQGHTKVQALLGLMHNEGQAVQQDSNVAEKWITLAAEQGKASAHAREKDNLEQSLHEGLKSFRAGDCASAERIWLPPAEKGMVLAQIMLAMIVYGGFCEKTDEINAAKWSERAANRGEMGSHLDIAGRYSYGRGVIKDLVKALMWLNIAEILGADIHHHRSVFANRHKPSPYQIEAARKLTVLWRKKFDQRLEEPLVPSAYGAYISGKITAIHGNDAVELYGQIIRLFGIAVPPVDTKIGAEANEYLTTLVGEQASCLIVDGSNPNAKVGECSLSDYGIGELLIKKVLARDCAKKSGGRYRRYETNDSRVLPLPRDCRLKP